jgi:hypothetical protein
MLKISRQALAYQIKELGILIQSQSLKASKSQSAERL